MQVADNKASVASDGDTSASSVSPTSGYNTSRSTTPPGQSTLPTTTFFDRPYVAVKHDTTNLISASTIRSTTIALTTTTTTTHVPRAVVLTNAVVMTTSVAAALSVVAVVTVVWMIGRYYFGSWQRHRHPDTASRSSTTSRGGADDLMDEVARIHWRDVEPLIDDTLRFIDVARRTTVFRSVTAYDVFAYKFRTDSDGGGVGPTSPRAGWASIGDHVDGRYHVGGRLGRGPFATLKQVEHLFELLTLCSPPSTTCLEADEICSVYTKHTSMVILNFASPVFLLRLLKLTLLGRHQSWSRSSSQHAGLSFGRSLSLVALRTHLVWCDDSRPLVRRVIGSFIGNRLPSILSEFDSSSEPNRSLATRVLAAVPYIRSLRLVGHRFVLDVVADCSDDEDDDDDDDLAIEMREAGDRKFRAAIRDVDRRLSDADVDSIAVAWLATTSSSVRSPTADRGHVVDAYRELRDICLSTGIVHPGSDYPDPDVTAVMALSRVECIVLIRHLIRLLCGVATNVRRSSSMGLFGGRFRRVIDRLDGAARISSDCRDADGDTNESTAAVVDRRRRSPIQLVGDNLVACATALTGDLLRSDVEHTKTVLERVERLLSRQYHRVADASRLSGSGAEVEPSATRASSGAGDQYAAAGHRTVLTERSDGDPSRSSSSRHRWVVGSTANNELGSESIPPNASGKSSTAATSDTNAAITVGELAIFTTSSSSSAMSADSTEGMRVLQAMVGGVLETAL